MRRGADLRRIEEVEIDAARDHAQPVGADPVELSRVIGDEIRNRDHSLAARHDRIVAVLERRAEHRRRCERSSQNGSPVARAAAHALHAGARLRAWTMSMPKSRIMRANAATLRRMTNGFFEATGRVKWVPPLRVISSASGPPAETT